MILRSILTLIFSVGIISFALFVLGEVRYRLFLRGVNS